MLLPLLVGVHCKVEPPSLRWACCVFQPHYLKTDFNKWKDEDDSDEDDYSLENQSLESVTIPQFVVSVFVL